MHNEHCSFNIIMQSSSHNTNITKIQPLKGIIISFDKYLFADPTVIQTKHLRQYPLQRTSSIKIKSQRLSIENSLFLMKQFS